MAVTEIKTGKQQQIRIVPVGAADYKMLTKKRFSFAWKLFKSQSDIAVYQLLLQEKGEILGAMALIDHPLEYRMEIKLLACSRENVGPGKTYEGIAGHLMAYACRLALAKYGSKACVSLVPKTSLKNHYISRYGAWDAGWQLFWEGRVLHDMILKYL